MGLEHVILLAIAAFVIYRYATRKERAVRKEKARQERQLMAENSLPEVQTNLHVILESIDIFRKTKKIDTARSRYEVAIERLEYLTESFPHRADWKQILVEFQEEGRQYFQDAISASIKKHVEKASLAKSVSTKISNLNKAILEVSEASESDLYDREFIEKTRAYLDTLVHGAELENILESAERYEFKQDWKKALSAYQDALFFLKKDTIPDEMQDGLLKNIEGKVETLKQRAAGIVMDAPPA